MTQKDWAELKPVFNCPFGMTNVWEVSQLRSKERMKKEQKAIHLNQKPLSLIEAIITMSSNEGDVVWDPFAGLCTTAIACKATNREVYCSEINPKVFEQAKERIINSCHHQK